MYISMGDTVNIAVRDSLVSYADLKVYFLFWSREHHDLVCALD